MNDHTSHLFGNSEGPETPALPFGSGPPDAGSDAAQLPRRDDEMQGERTSNGAVPEMQQEFGAAVEEEVAPFTTKYCSRCGYDKPIGDFYPTERGKLKLSGYCKDCVRNYKLNTDNKARARAKDKKKRDKLKDQFIAAYGGKCECCGESEPDFLTIDHKDNNGEAHRKSISPNKRRGGSTSEVLRVLRKEGWPNYVRILCFNCNFGRRNRGACAHKRKRLMQ